MAFLHLSLRWRFVLLTCAVLVTLGAVVIQAKVSTTAIRVQGPIYTEIVLAKDLTADILPPPAYILEAYLTAYRMLEATSPTEVDRLVTTMERLQSEFATRQQFWVENLQGDEARQVMLQDARTSAERFFTMCSGSFLTDLRAGRHAEAKTLLAGDMSTAYERHRQAIDRVVVLALDMVKAGEQKASEQVESTQILMIGLVSVAIMLMIVFVLVMARSIIQSLRAMGAAVERVATGDYAGRITVTSNDDVGVLSTRLNGLFERLGALDQRLRTSIGGNANALTNAATRLGTTSAAMTEAASQSDTRAQSAAAGAAQVSANVATVATSVTEMTTTATEIARQSSQAAQVAREGVQVAQGVGATVQSLGERSTQIGEIVGTISSIAAQTNLLALNATIEAARAGDAGRGFAVVANEVKELARQASTAAENIGQRVTAIQTDIQSSVAGVQRLAEIVARIDQTQQSIAAAVEEQVATTSEVGRSVAEAATGNANVQASVAAVANAAQMTTRGSQDVQQAAADMTRLAAELSALVQ